MVTTDGQLASLVAGRQAIPTPAHRTRCENGNCQSAPLAPPSDPLRVSIVKRIDFISNTRLARLALERDAWSRAADSRMPQSPFLEVASPPPKSI